MIFQGKEFRKYDEHYYVSADGDIYSTYKKILDFASISAFIEYAGHSVANGAISKCKSHKWFQLRYEIVDDEGVETIKSDTVS